jgi:hypothetical protein
MVVLVTVDDFRATICALRSLDVSKGVSFQTFSLPEDRCICLLASRKKGKDPGGLPPPSQPLIRLDLSAGLCGRLSILTAGDQNAKHVDWN